MITGPKFSYTAAIVAAIVALTCSSFANAACPPGNTITDISAPTDVSRTHIRKGLGEYETPLRQSPHPGVDVLPRGSYTDSDAFAVRAMADGTVAYAQFNGGRDDPSALDKGFGNVVIIDHGADCYVMFAHLSSKPFTPFPKDPSAALLVQVGSKVKKGDIIGYFVDHTKGVYSTGNAMRTDAGAIWQTHIGFIDAPSGRSGTGSYRDIFLKQGGKWSDPTPTLRDLGYKVD